MSGHSRWSQIKHKKAIADAKKGAVFGKIARAISVAARGNPDPSTNLRLKAEIERARAVNMPGDNIERAVHRAGDKNAADLSEVQLEFIGPGNAAVIVSAITDNTNRTIAELKQVGAKHGGHMAGKGAVAWMFRRAGIIRLPADASDELQLQAIDAGADDVSADGDGFTVTTAPEHLQSVREALGPAALSAGVEMVPSTPLSIPDSAAAALTEFLEALDGHDDVQDVATNATLP